MLKSNYDGKRIKADVGMMGSAFNVNGKSRRKKDESGEPYFNGEDIISGIWSKDKEGNIILEIKNDGRILLKKQSAPE